MQNMNSWGDGLLPLLCVRDPCLYAADPFGGPSFLYPLSSSEENADQQLIHLKILRITIAYKGY